MATAVSPQKRQANRRNALRSTGPKSSAGKKLASRNSVKHGLSVSVEHIKTDPLRAEVSRLIEQEGIDAFQAREIATRILAYERNLDYQRKLLTEPPERFINEEKIENATRDAFATELDMLDDWLDWRRFDNGRLTPRDLRMAVGMKLDLVKYSVRELEKQQKALCRDAQNSLRYLKRSSNQLVKSLKALGRA